MNDGAFLLLALVCSLPIVAAPVGLSFSLSGVPLSPAALAAVGTAAAAAAGAIHLVRKSTPSTVPSWCSPNTSTQPPPKKYGGESVPFGLHEEQLSSEDEEESCTDCSDEDGDDEPPSTSNRTAGSTSGNKAAASKLWSAVQFPEGTNGPANYGMANLTAAQQWICPCKDRDNCIGKDRITVLQLYEHRKQFRTTAASRGGLRDTNRTQMEQHYDKNSRSFTRSFVVGNLGDCCAASAGLANGLSFASWSESRVDVRQDRPWHEGRQSVRGDRQSMERGHLEAYIRSLRGTTEGPKGGSQANDKWSTAKMSIPQRWQEYVKARTSAGQPIIGSQPLFKKLWKAHNEIREFGAKGHATCDECGEIEAELAKYAGRSDVVGRSKYSDALVWKERHSKEHRGERDYADDWWHTAEMRPQKVTALSIDAPTEQQFDVPVQKRTSKDPVKKLDGAKKWSSKITGVLIAGLGMLTYVTRDGLGSGPNLSCTVFYLALLQLVASNHPIGNAVHILLDNTTGDNKHNEMIFFLAWLVMTDACTEASFFCMIKGHTYCQIDQTFRTLIRGLLAMPIWTVSTLLEAIKRFLQAYNCLSVVELHCLWDWKSFFAPHVHERFTGFATSQFGSGMHEFVLRKDRNGDVRLRLRKSSRASSWLPEGEGYLVFKSMPQGVPKLAKAKDDATWKRSTVESTIRTWFRYMTVNPAELVRIRTEWESRFAALPPNGDVEQLSPSQQLRWVELPRRVEQRSSSRPSVSGASSALENPEINPVTGHGRTAADVKRELQAYKAAVRATAPNAVFNADYLFVQRPNCSLSLQRVAHHACIEDATAPNISVTTVVYDHQPQPGHPGFWGHFTLKPNVQYNAADSSTGTKFVREENVERQDVVAYNIEMFETPSPTPGGKKLLRVSASSLSALSEVCPEQPRLPQGLPATHAAKEPTAKPAGRTKQPKQKQAAPEGDSDQPKQKQAAPEGDSDDEEEGGEDPDDEEEEWPYGREEQFVGGQPSEDRTGKAMEVQGCDPDVCDYMCGECEWDTCVVLADNGRTCDVRICLHDGVHSDFPDVANRFLRFSAPTTHRAKRVRSIK